MPKQFLIIILIFPFLLVTQEPPHKKQKTGHLPEKSEVKKLFDHMSAAFANIPKEPITISKEKQSQLQKKIAQLIISIAFLQRTDLPIKDRIVNLKEKKQELLELYQEVKPMYQQLNELTKHSCEILKITKPLLQDIEQEAELDDKKLFEIIASTNLMNHIG